MTRQKLSELGSYFAYKCMRTSPEIQKSFKIGLLG